MEKRTVGNVVRFVKRDEVLYGLVVRQRQTDLFSYVNFEKCLYELRKHLKNDEFTYVGIEAFCVSDDDVTMEKVISVMKGVLTAPGLELYVCWPEQFRSYCRWSGETR